MEDVLEGDNPATIGADYIKELIEESVKKARPVTARTANDDATYVIIANQNGGLQAINVR